MGEFRIMGKEGDVKKIWNPDNKDETEDAHRSFNELTKKGYLAFKVKKDGEKGQKITKFDPDAGTIIMTPPIVGG